MRIDYHMHFEYGSYDVEWIKGFFESAKKRGIDEIGITEHTHGFIEFKELYNSDLILDDSYIGNYQKIWLGNNKFKYSLKDYDEIIKKLKSTGYPVKFGLEVCNFQNQAKVAEIIGKYEFDYIIGSVHFLNGWGYDLSAIKDEWDKRSVYSIYKEYVAEVEKMCASGLYDVLGHPFNIRMFKYFPEKDVTELLERAAAALKKADMAIDINTGTLYRYPIEEISPWPEFMKVCKKYNIPIIFSSDSHKPEDVGSYIDKAIEYAKGFGYDEFLVFEKRERKIIKI